LAGPAAAAAAAVSSIETSANQKYIIAGNSDSDAVVYDCIPDVCD